MAGGPEAAGGGCLLEQVPFPVCTVALTGPWLSCQRKSLRSEGPPVKPQTPVVCADRGKGGAPCLHLPILRRGVRKGLGPGTLLAVLLQPCGPILGHFAPTSG